MPPINNYFNVFLNGREFIQNSIMVYFIHLLCESITLLGRKNWRFNKIFFGRLWFGWRFPNVLGWQFRVWSNQVSLEVIYVLSKNYSKFVQEYVKQECAKSSIIQMTFQNPLKIKEKVWNILLYYLQRIWMSFSFEVTYLHQYSLFYKYHNKCFEQIVECH